MRHSSDLVVAEWRDNDVMASTDHRRHRGVEGTQRRDDRSEKDQSHQQAEDGDTNDNRDRGSGGRCRTADCQIARSPCLLVEFAAQFGQPILNCGRVAASCGKQCIADHTFVVGIGVNGLKRFFHIRIGLGADFSSERRIGGRELAQICVERSASVPGVALRKNQLADSEVGQPVANITEFAAGAACRIESLEKIGRGGGALGIGVHLADDDDVGDDEGDQQQADDRTEAKRNRRTTQKVRYRFQSETPELAAEPSHHWNSVTLMAAPRSPSSPPSLG